MKIAVTSTGQTLDSQVDPRFGRAAYFIIIDTETMQFEAFVNDNVQAGGGAGISSAQNIAQAGASAVLTGNCGPNAERTLAAANIKLYIGVSGTAQQAVEDFKQGKLTQTAGPNVQSHFGTGS
ncbi:MAG: NifB/NifX family molybdenum-iron cluster-binding protein [Phycisphaerae bacterium]